MLCMFVQDLADGTVPYRVGEARPPRAARAGQPTRVGRC
jgi:hypothetical protein